MGGERATVVDKDHMMKSGETLEIGQQGATYERTKSSRIVDDDGNKIDESSGAKVGFKDGHVVAGYDRERGVEDKDTGIGKSTAMHAGWSKDGFEGSVARKETVEAGKDKLASENSVGVKGGSIELARKRTHEWTTPDATDADKEHKHSTSSAMTGSVG